MEQILLGVTVVSIVIVSLVLIINFAESKLLPQGNVSILINNDLTIIKKFIGPLSKQDLKDIKKIINNL